MDLCRTFNQGIKAVYVLVLYLVLRALKESHWAIEVVNVVNGRALLVNMFSFLVVRSDQ